MSLSVGGVRWSEVAPKALIGKCQIPKKRADPDRTSRGRYLGREKSRDMMLLCVRGERVVMMLS